MDTSLFTISNALADAAAAIAPAVVQVQGRRRPASGVVYADDVVVTMVRALGREDGLHVRTGDGYLGWPEQAPFDAIMVTAAPDHVPQPLVDQLAVSECMIIPVGVAFQDILLVSRTPTGIVQQRTIPVRFVPLVRPPR